MGGRLTRLMVLLGLVVLACGCGPRGDGGAAGEEPGRAAPAGEGRLVTVTRITDGDTFRADEERIRLIGVDTPEVSGGVECYGREASAALEALIPVGTEVRLVADVETRDRYDRTLAYVYRASDDLHVNLRLARDGYASPLTVPPNVAHEDAFARAAADARQAGRGLWSACPDDAPPDDGGDDAAPADDGSDGDRVAPATGSTTLPPEDPTATGDDGGRCDRSYPGVCIPPAPPDLDCGDIAHRRFTVLPPDPHHLDGGGDGVGCEGGSP